jgi:hypothetical protein
MKNPSFEMRLIASMVPSAKRGIGGASGSALSFRVRSMGKRATFNMGSDTPSIVAVDIWAVLRRCRYERAPSIGGTGARKRNNRGKQIQLLFNISLGETEINPRTMAC